MTTPYHHGHLRQALLTEGRHLLVGQGLEAVTLRELARRAGVSNAAPRRHFADRDALLAAIAAEGFDELTEILRTAAGAGDRRARLSSYAQAYVRFAIDNGPLVALMFSLKSADGTGPLPEAAGRFFTLGAEMLGQDAGRPLSAASYLVPATLEGISSLVAAGRLPEEQVREVVESAVAMLLTQLPE